VHLHKSENPARVPHTVTFEVSGKFSLDEATVAANALALSPFAIEHVGISAAEVAYWDDLHAQIANLEARVVAPALARVSGGNAYTLFIPGKSADTPPTDRKIKEWPCDGEALMTLGSALLFYAESTPAAEHTLANTGAPAHHYPYRRNTGRTARIMFEHIRTAGIAIPILGAAALKKTPMGFTTS
jgi:hypothetical protein